MDNNFIQPQNTNNLAPVNNKKRIKTLLIILIVFIVLILTSFLIINKIFKSKKPSDNEVQFIQEQDRKQAFDQALEKTYQTDKDFDGLSDQAEFKYGTSPTSTDSDHDGLSDSSEIFRFGTDPLNKDTDGDGYNDGEEVRSGYSPTNTGKL